MGDLGDVELWVFQQRPCTIQPRMQQVVEKGLAAELPEQPGHVVGMKMQKICHLLPPDGMMEVFLKELAGRLPGESRLASFCYRWLGLLRHFGGLDEEEFHEPTCGEIIGW